MTNKARGNKKSLGEKSMNLVLNITKLSVLSLAERSLGTKSAPAPATGNRGTVTDSLAVKEAILMAPHVPAQRSQEPESISKPLYLMEPPGETHLIREGRDINGEAVDFIQRIHARNRNDSYDTPFILPPPPPRK